MAVDEGTGYTFALAMTSKGGPLSLEYQAASVVKFLTMLRHKKARMRADGDPTITLLVQLVKQKWDGELIAEPPPRYSSASNG